LQANYQGSIDSVADGSGNLIGINTYDEYGKPGAANIGTFQYTGQVWLAELGIYYYKARMYDPRLGRFLQTDPVGYKDDLDLYAYVGNDPIDGRDPTGLYVCSGSKDNCNAVGTAISTAQAAVKSGKLTKTQAAAVSKALAFYGKAGEKNGVTINFSDTISALGQTSMDSKT